MARAKVVEKDPSRIVHEVEAIVCAALGAVLALSFLSYVPDSPAVNHVGRVGYALADVLIQCFGLASYLFPLLLAVGATSLFVRLSAPVSPLRIAGAVALLLVCSVALGLYRDQVPAEAAGGWVGGFLSTLMSGAFGLVGSSVVLAAILLLVFIMLTGLALSDSFGALWRLTRRATTALWGRIRSWVRLAVAFVGEQLPRFAAISWRRRRARTAPEAPTVVFENGASVVEETAGQGEPRVVRLADEQARAATPAGGRRPAEQEEFLFDVDDSDFHLPPTRLLGACDDKGDYGDEKALLDQSRILEQKLATFGISGRVVAVRPGPVITTFELEPEAGVKVSRVVNLSDDLTMALRAHGVRIVAPIPGKNVIGIEVSNRHRATVGLRDLIEGDEFQASPSPLTLAIGRDTTGASAYADLTRMPHLLMAGATGTGKSVSLNAMILSILYKATPRDVRFIMIDPKMLELSLYEGIPHLLLPVVTDIRKASAALVNLMHEMDRRFEMLRDMGVRSIDDYNRRLEEKEDAWAGEELEGEDLKADAGLGDDVDEDPEEEEGWEQEDEDGDSEEILHEHLPRIVVVVDELADLMMVVGREIETSITRLAQKARAAGIHLILATQRPSVDVITGLIKANFPCRISFKVTARPDSRTILDGVGAERLLGDGDMLYLAPATSFLRRLHGALISDREIRAIVEYLKRQGDPEYCMRLLDDVSAGAEVEEDEEFFDELYDRAVDLVIEQGQGSTSWLQRKLGIGYNRAARIMEHMEREGLVGPADGVRPRKVIAGKTALG